MADYRPLRTIEQGAPVWRVQVEDPQALMAVPTSCSFRLIKAPGGDLFAAALRLFDMPERPQVFHLAGPWSDPDLRAWVQAAAHSDSLRLRAERKGWANASDRDLEIDTHALLSTVRGAEPEASDAEGALLAYVAFYQAQYPRLHSPEAVWDAYEASLRAPAAVAEPRSWKWLWVLLGLAAAGTAYLISL